LAGTGENVIELIYRGIVCCGHAMILNMNGQSFCRLRKKGARFK